MLKQIGCIDYDSKIVEDYDVRVANTTVRFDVSLLDTPHPQKCSSDKEDYFTVIDLDIINKMLEVGLKSKHILTYILLSRFKDGLCNISYQGMEKLTGIHHTTLNNKICIELEQKGFISNYLKDNTSHKHDGKQNNFVVLRNIKGYEQFKQEHQLKITENYEKSLVRKMSKLFS